MIVLVVGYILLILVIGGVLLMLLSGRRILIEEIRALKLRMMHRPASLKGKSRINKVG